MKFNKFDILFDHKFVRENIQDCQKRKHIQQVAFSTYHDCLTQICFTCKMIRTELKKEQN
ncbi:hypothetical protein LCGC14_0953720 [marine sediment metagenome]|uniref:Uncharacterized protein n=1 Tax=marine sediment metagenome TaxID=412755 RepID=A0A0F9P2I0_9ZZZZ